MTRPQYEAAEDRANEFSALSKFARAWDVFIGPRDETTGATFLHNKDGSPVVFAEVKCRRIPSFRYRSLKLSAKKVAHAKAAWTTTSIPTVLVVQFVDRLMFTKLYPLKTPLPECVWGRSDRGDPEDIEKAVEISMDKFLEVV